MEKHRRGAAARHTRAIAKSIAATKGSKLKRKSGTTNAPPNKKRRRECELPSGKNKHDNHAKKPPLVRASTKKTVNTRVLATKAPAKMAKASSSHGRADNTRNSEPFTTGPQRSSYQHPNGYHGECSYPPQRHPYNDHNLRAFEVGRGIHPIYPPSYNLGAASPSMFRMPHGHVPYNYNMGYAQRPPPSSYLYENPRFHGWRRP